MKTSLKIFALGLILAGFGINANAQSTASATGSATVITPISLSKTVDMQFGNLAINNTTGTIVLSPEGTRTPGGGVTLPAATGTVTAASFSVTGSGSSTFSITLPATAYTITRASGTETMTVTSFTSTPSGTGTLSGGSQTITVGGTLNVGAAQVAGTYTNGTGFNVTVNYN